MRYSKQRETILKAVKETKQHPSAEWVFDRVRGELPNISRGTVYRNLNQLAEEGMIRRLFDHGHVRYDGMTERHDHFRCTRCARLFDLVVDMEDVKREMLDQQGYQVTDYTLEITGICPACAKESSAKEGTT